jgi:hypothetical protein
LFPKWGNEKNIKVKHRSAITHNGRVSKTASYSDEQHPIKTTTPTTGIVYNKGLDCAENIRSVFLMTLMMKSQNN